MLDRWSLFSHGLEFKVVCLFDESVGFTTLKLFAFRLRGAMEGSFISEFDAGIFSICFTGGEIDCCSEVLYSLALG